MVTKNSNKSNDSKSTISRREKIKKSASLTKETKKPNTVTETKQNLKRKRSEETPSKAVNKSEAKWNPKKDKVNEVVKIKKDKEKDKFVVMLNFTRKKKT